MDELLQRFDVLDYKETLLKEEFSTPQRLALLSIDDVVQMGITSRFALAAFRKMIEFLNVKIAEPPKTKPTRMHLAFCSHFLRKSRCFNMPFVS